MSMAEFQAVLGRIYIDEALRALLRLAPAQALAGYHLTEAETRALLGIDHDQLEHFCAGLRGKKLSHIADTYAAAFRLCPEICTFYFRRYYGMRPRMPQEHPSVYTYDFGVFLEDCLLAEPVGELPFAPDLVRFEREFFLAASRARSTGHTDGAIPAGPTREPDLTAATRPRLRPDVTLYWFAVDVIKLNAALRAATPPNGTPPHGAPPNGAPPGGVEPAGGYVAFKSATRSGPQLYRLSTRLGRALKSCDGVRDITRLARSPSAPHATRDGATRDGVPEMIAAIQNFRKLGLVVCE
jgi:hypothetical protein